MSKDEALKMALDALQNHSGNYKLSKAECVQHNAVVDALRQALQEPDTGIDRGAWSGVPDATKWVDELRGDRQSEWQALTSEELTDIVDFYIDVYGYIDIYGHMDIPHTFARAVEAKLKEKNK